MATKIEKARGYYLSSEKMFDYPLLKITVLTKTQNKPIRPTTSQIEQKLPETTSKNCETTHNHPKFQNWGNLEFSTRFRLSNFPIF